MTIRDRITRALSEFVRDVPEPAAPEKPEAGEWRSGVRDDFTVDLAARRASPQKLGTLMRNADEGDIAAMIEVFEEVERDPRVSRLYSKRRQAVVGKDLLFTPANDEPSAQKAADLCTEIVDGITDWHDAVFDLSDAIGKGFAAGQVVWDLRDGRFIPTRIKRWPQSAITFGDQYNLYQQTEDEPRILTDSDPVNGELLSGFPAGQWIFHVQREWSQPIPRAALFRAVAWYWLFKRFGMRDWSIFLERFGIPPRMGRYHAGADDKERLELWKAVSQLGKDHACIYPEGSTIEVLELKGTMGTSPHPDMIQHCNEEIAIAISGSTMSVTQGDRGARSAKEAYQTEEYAQAVSDASNLARTIRDQLCAPLIRLNLGDGYPTPNVSFDLDVMEDLDVRSQVDERIQGMGFPITAGYVSDRYNVELPEEVERTEVLDRSGGEVAAALTDMVTLAAEKKKAQAWAIRRSSRSAGLTGPRRPTKD